MTYVINPSRFSSSFSPDDLSGLVLWLDAADGSTLWQDSGGTTQVSAVDDTVAKWDDKSSGGNDAIKVSTSNLLYKESFNSSYPCVYFPGGTDSFLSIPLSESAGDWTVFFTCARTASTTTNPYFMDVETGRLVLGTNLTNLGFYDGDFTVGSGGLLDDGTPYIVRYELNSTGTSGKLYLNGTSFATGVYTQKAIGGNVRLGGRYNDGLGDARFQGYMASVLIYSGNLSSADISLVESYLTDRYGL